jgi:hypothetical protein
MSATSCEFMGACITVLFKERPGPKKFERLVVKFEEIRARAP